MINTILKLLFCFYYFIGFKVDAKYGEPDFAQIVQSNWFADKTLLIKDFINEHPDDPWVKVVTAPTRFGKSTIIDMIKRFLSIEIDNTGTPIDYKNNTNYDLFCKKPLKICKNNLKFINNHFGRYPVIHINYSPLRDTDNFRSLLVNMRTVLADAFKQHSYLLVDEVTWPRGSGISKQDVDKFIKGQKAEEFDLKNGLKNLAQVLHNYFGKKVIILLDEYDAFCGSILFEKVDEMNKMIIFLKSMSEQLFKYNHHLERALLTGILRIKDIGMSPPGNNFRDYSFFGNHAFSNYYGFTKEEIDELVSNNIKGKRERKKTLNSLREYYGGYQIQGKNTKLYSIWSVINYFTENKVFSHYWCRTQYINYLLKIFSIDKVADTIKSLLFTNALVYADISTPLNKDIITALKEAKDSLGFKNGIEEGWFYSYLFDLGYLSPTVTNIIQEGKIPLKIPNREIYLEFCNILRQYYKLKHTYNDNVVTRLQNVVASLRAGRTTRKVYKEFHRVLYQLVNNSNHYPLSENDLQSFIFVSLIEKFPIGTKSTTEFYTKVCFTDKILKDVPLSIKASVNFMYAKLKNQKDRKVTLNKYMEEIRGRIDIIVINEHNMTMVIETKFRKTKSKNEPNSLQDLAKEALARIYLTYHEYVNNNAIFELRKSKGMLYVGIAYDKQTRDMSMAFYSPPRRKRKKHQKDVIFINYSSK